MEHGLHSRLYRIWRCMKMRCYSPSHEAYPRYGGSGIEVCAEWRHDFKCFRAWALSNGYADHLTIDRKKNEKNYEPENCRWSTMLVQQRNRRNNLSITAFGETKLIKEWAEDSRCLVSYRVLWRRLRSGREPEWAMRASIHQDRRRKPLSVVTKRKIAEAARNRTDLGRTLGGQFTKEKR
jgi:hypothetical protein